MKAFHVDEALYLPAARHILQDPWHPFSFQFNWYGRSLPYSQINNTPPMLPYLLALAIKTTGGSEVPMRLFFLPFDLISACALYGLASRLLRWPLGPTLAVLAAPSYGINMGHLMAEKLVMAFGLSALYALVRALDERRASWYWVSAALLAAACLSKYNGVVFLIAAVGYALRRGVPASRIVAYVAVSLSGLSAYLVWDLWTSAAVSGAAWRVTSQAFSLPASAPNHRARAMLAFLGGCGGVTALWPYRAYSPRGALLPLAALTAGILFLPAFDIGPAVRPVDRLLGVALAAGAAWNLCGLLLRSPRTGGWFLWAPWVLGTLAIQALYWSVMARVILLAVPPLIFAMAEKIESQVKIWELRWIYKVSFITSAVFSLLLAAVDMRYANFQREVAREILREQPPERLWCAGHWGLQEYLEQQGRARMLDLSRGGWDEVRPGDLVVVPTVNSNVIRPRQPVLANLRSLEVSFHVPLRLISIFNGQGAFYSSVGGFLPFSLSLAPLDHIDCVEVLGQAQR